jgi:YjjG family noncanonical pyrimidine nucleotidase
MQPYQWLLFDADGTLFDYDKAESIALREAFRRIDVTFDPAYLAAYRQINHALWEALERGELTPNLLKVRRFEQLLHAVGVAFPPAAFSASYLDCLAACSELIAGVPEMLHALQGKYRMAILTNGLQAVQRPRLAGSVIHHHFADMIISEEIGVAKPARQFFDAALARLGNPARREVLMIGDNWASDIVGATQYGLDACWYNPSRKPRPAGGAVTREIASLSELIGWLG